MIEIKTAHCPHCGAELEADDNRSSPDNRRFFKLIRCAFYHWPEGHAFKPRNAEHLRNWLYVEVNHCNVDELQFASGISAISPVMVELMRLTAEEALQRANGKGFIRVLNGALHVVTPRTSRFLKRGQCGLSQREFNAVRDRVTALIELITGATAEQLLSETASAGVQTERLDSGEH